MATGDEIIITIAGDSAPLLASLAEGSAGFDDIAASGAAASADISASMEGLIPVLDDVTASTATVSAAMDDMAASSTGAAAGTDSVAASASIATPDVEGLAGAMGALGTAFDAVTGQITSLAATFGTLIAIMGAMTIINDVSSWIQNLVQQMFQLDQQTQKTVNSWQYLFATGPGGGKSAAQSLAQWAYQESPNLPFTAMDLRGAISTLGTAGYSAQQIEQFIPFLADIASTLGTAAYGGQGVTLSQAANAIRSAGFGLTRMLRTDLGISPAQLVQYGLDATVSSSGAVKIKNMATLIPALENFVAGRGLKGAAQEQETQTFWGAWSSFQDYLQNFLQTMGGINPQTGSVTSGSFFGGLQNVLVAVNSVLGGPQGTAGAPAAATPKGGGTKAYLQDLNQEAQNALPTLLDVSKVLGDIFGGLVTSGTSLLSGLFSGLGGAGGESMLMGLFNAFRNFGQWLNSAPIQADLKKIGETLGNLFGQMMQVAQSALPDLGHAFENLKAAWEKLTGSMSGAQGNQFKAILGGAIEVTAAIITFAAALITAVAAVNKFANSVDQTIVSWGAGLVHFFQNLGNQFKTWGANLIQMLIDGIKSMLPALGGMINNVAQSIASHLGFHSPPKEGPLSDSNLYMPNMMAMFAADIQRGIPLLARASQMAAAAIGGALHPGSAGYGIGGGVSNVSYSSAVNYGATSPTLNMYGANQAQMNLLITQVLQQLDRQHNVALQQPGGWGYRAFGPIG